MLRAFSARRYRTITTDELKLGGLNVVIGPNNSGKSTLLDAMGFVKGLLFTNAPRDAFLHALNKRGRGDVLDRAIKPPFEIQMKWVLSSRDAPDLTYELHFNAGRSEDFPGGVNITKELLRYAEPTKGKKESRVRFIDCHSKKRGEAVLSAKDSATGRFKLHTVEIDAQATVFGQLEAMRSDRTLHNDVYPHLERTADFMRSYFEGFHVYSSSQLDPKKTAEGVPTDLSVRSLDSTGSELVNVLRYIDQEHDLLEEYAARLRELIPDLRRVRVLDVSETRKQVLLEMADKQRFKLGEMSDGTLRAMLLALLCFTPERMKLLAIEEPEQSMHPAWQKVIGRWLVTARGAEQIIVTTHSPDLLDQLTEPFREGKVALLVCEKQGKEIRRLQAKELDSFFKEGWELGDLYRAGEPKLGGWPW